MKFKLTTLVDITETNIRKGPDKLAIGQQSNYDTLIQVIGLRANPEPVSVKQEQGTKKEFGTAYKGKQTFWEFVFEVPESATSIEALITDFHLVPFVNSLTETAKINTTVFDTTNPTTKNVFFEEIK